MKVSGDSCTWPGTPVDAASPSAHVREWFEKRKAAFGVRTGCWSTFFLHEWRRIPHSDQIKSHAAYIADGNQRGGTKHLIEWKNNKDLGVGGK